MGRPTQTSLCLFAVTVGLLRFVAESSGAENNDPCRIAIEQELGLTLAFGPVGIENASDAKSAFKAEKANDAEIRRDLPLLAAELLIYPRHFFEKATIKRIVLQGKISLRCSGSVEGWTTTS